MTNIFEACKTLKETLDALRPLKKEDEIRVMQKFRLDWNYHSNHLEGNTLTYGETKALILFGITAQGKPLKDHFEITGHNDAINWVLSLVKQERALNENFIRELHALILKESYEIDAITPDGQPSRKRVKVGEYKTTPNHVKTKTGEIFRFATPEETPILMNELIQWYNLKSKDTQVNPILLAAEFHYRYIRIHPFDDGNGRTARILMNFILLRFGYPPVIIKTEDKHNYFAVLRQADGGRLTPFIEYIATNLKDSLEIIISGANGESIEEKDDLEKEIALLEQSFMAVGRTVEVQKNQDVLLQLFDNSIVPTVNYFFEKSELMNRFYFTSDYGIWIDEIRVLDNLDGDLRMTRERVKVNTKRIFIQYTYKSLKQLGFEDFNFSTSIKIDLGKSNYTMQSGSGYKIDKLYGEDLSWTEMKSLVDKRLREHKEIIQTKVESLRKK